MNEMENRSVTQPVFGIDCANISRNKIHFSLIETHLGKPFMGFSYFRIKSNDFEIPLDIRER